MLSNISSQHNALTYQNQKLKTTIQATKPNEASMKATAASVKAEIEATFGDRVGLRDNSKVHGHISIAPNILQKMADDPEVKKYYMEQIRGYYSRISPGEDYVSVLGCKITGTGVTINADGSVNCWVNGCTADSPSDAGGPSEERDEREKMLSDVAGKSEYENCWSAEKSAEAAQQAREIFAAVGDSLEQTIESLGSQIKAGNVMPLSANRFDRSF